MNRIPALRRLGAQFLRSPVTRGGGGGYPEGKFFSEGTQTGLNGFPFGEIPPPPGQVKQKLWFEDIWTYGYGAFFLGAFIIYNTKNPESLSPYYWAAPRAEKELDIELRMMDKLNARPDLQERLSVVLKDLNMIEEESYDLIMMRNEYKVKLGLHSGRVPADLLEIYEELAAE